MGILVLSSFDAGTSNNGVFAKFDLPILGVAVLGRLAHGQVLVGNILRYIAFGMPNLRCDHLFVVVKLLFLPALIAHLVLGRDNRSNGRRRPCAEEIVVEVIGVVLTLAYF